MFRIKRLGVACLSALLCSAPYAHACSDNVVRVIVPFSAGTSIDTATRIVFKRIGETLSETFLIVNTPGANGEIAAQYLKEAAPDGCTISSTGSSAYTIKAARGERGHMPYDPHMDLSAIGGTFEITFVLVVTARLQIHSMDELAAYARTHPDKLRIGTSYAIADATLALLRSQAGVENSPIPYRKGDVTSLPDLLADRIEGSIATIGVALPRIRSGELVPIFAIARTRNPLLPDTPTAAEVGIPELNDLASWQGLIGPPGMTEAARQRFDAALRSVLSEKATTDSLQTLGVRPDPSSSDTLDRRIERQLKAWGEVTRSGLVDLE